MTKSKLIWLIAGLLVTLGLVAAYFLTHPVEPAPVVTTPEISEKNIGLLQQAAHEKDTSICDQIKGGILPTDRNDSANQGDYGFEIGMAPKYDEMDEDQAKENCRKNVQHTIENLDNRN